jgi:hypothetical protein
MSSFSILIAGFREWSTVKTCFPTLGHIASYKILEQ